MIVIGVPLVFIILQPALDFFGRRIKSGTKGAGDLYYI